MKKQKNILNGKPVNNRNIKRSRARGIEYEQQIAKELRELGYIDIVTSRAESKAMDDNKIDLIDKSNNMPFYAQLKRTIKCPNYFAIEEECPIKDKPFVIFWNGQKPTEKTFRSMGEIVMLPKEFFYKLIKKYENL